MIVDDLGSLDKLSVLPFELLSQILEEYLDLESMMCVASANTALRKLVSSLPLVLRIRESKELALPFILLRHAQTAKFHTLRDFKASLQTVTCDICGIKSQFGTLANLLTLRRVCYLCVSRSHLCLPVPTDLVKSMFGLDETCLRDSGVRSARAISTHVRRKNPLRTSLFGYEVEIFHTFETVHNLQDVIDAAVYEYSKAGRPGILGLKSHIVNFLDSDLLLGPNVYHSADNYLDVHLSEKVSVTGIIHAVNVSWKGHADDARYAVVAPMPHLRLLDTLELGLTCQGCLRDRFYQPSWETVRKMNTAFLQEQLLVHIETCESAQMILQGQRLQFGEENAEIYKSGLKGRMCEIWDPFKDVKVPAHIRKAVNDLECGIERTPNQFRRRCAQIRDMIEQAKPERDKKPQKRSGSPKQAHDGNACQVKAPPKKREDQLQKAVRLSQIDCEDIPEKMGRYTAVVSQLE